MVAGHLPANHDEIIQLLVDNGAATGTARPVQKALEERSPEMVICLWEHGVKFSLLRKEREWALAIGVATGHSQLTTAMLTTEIKVNDTPVVWACPTVLQAAASRGYKQFVHQLIERGANINY